MPDTGGRLQHGRWHMARRSFIVSLLVLVIAPARSAAEAPDAEAVAQMRAFMGEMRAESRIDAARIDAHYTALLDEAPADRVMLARAWRDGRIAALPVSGRFNVRPRVGGAHPIGEKDLRHQRLYLGARRAALGLLLQIAARVRGGPLEVTSLVRHLAYQRELARSNPNARTGVPTHALGVAFDISILNSPRSTAVELRDVLQRMRDEGDLFFVAESQQLVFHVVVNPARAAYYRALFDVLARTPPPLAFTAAPRLERGPDVRGVLRAVHADLESSVAAGTGSLSRSFAGVVIAAAAGVRWGRRRRTLSRGPT